jgi:hypothetical protein
MVDQMKTGKSFEYALVVALFEKQKENNTVKITKNSSYDNVKNCFDSFDDIEKDHYKKAANHAIDHLLQLEPMLTNSELTLTVQKDKSGQSGDPRDIVILTPTNKEIGISAKNNNEMSIKSPRISPNLNFGKDWFGESCSEEYCETITQIFDEIIEKCSKNNILEWEHLENKNYFYKKFLDTFEKEFCLLIKKIPESAKILCQYAIGKQDYYLVMKSKNKVMIKAFNMRGTLNKPLGKIKPLIKINQVNFPTRIIETARKNHNKIIITFDEGWQLSFRIHNASKKIEKSLKLEVNFVGLPLSVYSHQENYC